MFMSIPCEYSRINSLAPLGGREDRRIDEALDWRSFSDRVPVGACRRAFREKNGLAGSVRINDRGHCRAPGPPEPGKSVTKRRPRHHIRPNGFRRSPGLRSAIRTGASHAHAAIDDLLSGYPGVTRYDVAERRRFVTFDLSLAVTRRYPPPEYAGIVVLRRRVPTSKTQVRRLLSLFASKPAATPHARRVTAARPARGVPAGDASR